MQKLNIALSTVALLLLTLHMNALLFAQGFDNYVVPQKKQDSRVQQVQYSPKPQTRSSQSVVRQSQPTTQTTTENTPETPKQNLNQAQVQQQSVDFTLLDKGQTQGGYVEDKEATSAIIDPPTTYRPTQEELAQLDEFLAKWEEYGKNIKRVSCDIHMREFDNVLQQDNKRPVAHTWGQFRFITPNKLSFHNRGEFEYTDANPNGEWKESQNEWKIVLDGKSFTQYDFKNKKAVVYPIPEEEQNIDLTMDNGQFPLFFVAKAETLKSRFYLRLVTPQAKQKDEVWIEAFPRYTRDAQQFQSITVILRLKDLQPTYMRKIGVNGKSQTHLRFEKIAVNKGLWTIEGSVDSDWTKDVREDQYSVLRQQTVISENGVVATVVTDPKQFPSNRPKQRTQTPTRQVRSAQTPTSAQRF